MAFALRGAAWKHVPGRIRDNFPSCVSGVVSGIAHAMRRLTHQHLLLAFIGLLIVALATGMVARPAPSEMDLRLEAWTMAGGSPGDLCADHGTDHKGGHCLLCNLTGPTGLPSVTAHLRDAERRILARIVLPQIRRAAGHARDPALPKRGPPRLT